MRAIAIGHLALLHSMNWDEAPEMKVYFNGVQVVEGKATGFTNSAVESAIIHCRALLEYLGLRGGKSMTELAAIPKDRKPDDHGIELTPGLMRISVAEALSAYPGEKQEAQAALAYVVFLANKALAHSTVSFSRHDEGSRLLEIAFRGVPALVCNAVYSKLGLRNPEFELSGRPRAA
jgi:hypothetical protein